MAKSVQTITTQGLDELIASLKALEDKEAIKMVRSSLRTGAKPMQVIGKELAPKLSGDLAKSIKVRAGKKRGSVVGVKIVTSKDDNLFKGDQFYGAFQEFGWMKAPTFFHDGVFKSRKKKAGGKKKKIEGKHFLRRAAEQGASQAVEDFAKDVSKRIDKFVKEQVAKGTGK